MPLFFRVPSIILFFCLLLFIFWISFIRYRSGTLLSDIGWKRTEYIYLLTGFFGLMSIVMQNKGMYLDGKAQEDKIVAENNLHMVKEMATSGSSENVCRTFSDGQRAQKSFVAIKFRHELNVECAYFKRTYSSLIHMKKLTHISLINLSGPQPTVGYQNYYESLNYFVNRYNTSSNKYATIESEISHKPDFYIIFESLGPYLISVAIALRITKVTWEIKKQQKKC